MSKRNVLFAMEHMDTGEIAPALSDISIVQQPECDTDLAMVDLNELANSGAAVSGIADIMSDSLDEDGLSKDAASIAMVAVEGIMGRLGIKDARRFAALENFGSDHTRMAVTRDALENTVLNVLSVIWRKFAEVCRWVWDKIYTYTVGLFNRESARQRESEMASLHNRIKAIAEGSKANIRVSAKALYIDADGKLDVIRPFFSTEAVSNPQDLVLNTVANNLATMQAMKTGVAEFQRCFHLLAPILIESRSLVEEMLDDGNKDHFALKTKADDAIGMTMDEFISSAFTKISVAEVKKSGVTVDVDTAYSSKILANGARFVFVKENGFDMHYKPNRIDTPAEARVNTVRYPSLDDLNKTILAYQETVNYFDRELSKTMEGMAAVRKTFMIELEATSRVIEALIKTSPQSFSDKMRDTNTFVKETMQLITSMAECFSGRMLTAVETTNKQVYKYLDASLTYYEQGKV